MTIFNQLYLFVFNKYKPKYKLKANSIALIYISILQISLVFLAGTFVAAFSNQMNLDLMSQSKAITFFVIIAIVIHFSNWMSYSGQSRKVMNAKYNKSKKIEQNVILVFCLPILAFLLGSLFLQSL
ncbi:hypothetical protein [Aurantibacter sp.]|uniref:hypothetical protein n=1 Tax=Aurantibacter sp. TaxID=2807103 RepID=UPI0035C7D0BF